MGNATNSATTATLVLRAQADGLFNANDIAQRIENMYLLEEGTLRSVWGPTAFVPVKTPGDWGTDANPASPVGDRPNSRKYSVDSAVIDPSAAAFPIPGTREDLDPTLPYYGFKQHGIYHCLLQKGGRDVLLLHTGDELWEFRGWERNWRRLISTPKTPYGIKDKLLDAPQADFPTQFEVTGNGVVIVPQDGRAYFYDGNYIAPLGFDAAPSSPMGRGPSSSLTEFATESLQGGINDIGYAHSSASESAMVSFANHLSGIYQYARNPDTAMTDGFGNCRIGTLQTLQTTDADDVGKTNTGWLSPGEWRCAVQYVDKWGNLSPLSPESNGVVFQQMPATSPGIEDPNDTGARWPYFLDRPGAPTAPEQVRFQLKWEAIPTGPEYCIGRRLYRTRDILNTADTALYLLPQNALSTTTAFATLPDNVVTMFPDNIPDTWLGVKAKQVLAVPQFRLCRMAMGRLWIGNLREAQGTARPSEASFWGTFVQGNDITPSPRDALTGMWAIPDGLLLCTKSSSFIVRASDDGQAFRHSPLSSAVGCIAPNSFATMATGLVVWLGKDGFYAYDGSKAFFLSPQLRRTFKRFTAARGSQAVATYDNRSREYRCWVSLDGDDHNQTCFVYDGASWRMRTDIVADCVCTTQDHRQYTLVGGHLPDDKTHSGVYLLDHDASPDIPALVKDRKALVETAWLEGVDSDKPKTSYVVYIWLRETENTSLTIEVLKNWRETVVETATAKKYSEKDIPDFWGTTKLDEGVWRDKRPFWTRAAVHIPSAESVKFRISGAGVWEFVGIQVKMSSRYYGAAQMTP